MKELKLNLLENAQDFAKEAILKAIAAETTPQEWKFAILHLVQAIELSLKELLRQQHPLLIFKNVDHPEHTVTIEQALLRLKQAASFDLPEDERSVLKTASRLRNDIIHHEFKAEPNKLKPAYAKLLGFLVEFYKIHLDRPLNWSIPEDVWLQGVKIKEYGEELYKRARAQMDKDGINDDSLIACPKCGWEAIVPYGDNQDTCYVCGNIEHLAVCTRCEKTMIWGEHEELDGKEYCWECMVYITDDYWYDSAKDKGKI